ncbi:MAG: glycosyltransferase, partial [Alicyclobacillus sp.]|nr:glycosyltransferase [Alicyclobacillus sp.]
HPALRKFAKFSLMQGVQRVPVLYGMFYRSMSRLQPSSSLQRQLNHLGMVHMKRCLRAFDPDAVVSTFPTPSGVLSELRASGFTDVPNLGILTDYTAHGQWVHDHIDMYFVATETVKAELMQFGVSGDRIQVTGMPVRSAFGDPGAEQLLQRRMELRRQYDLRTDMPLVLMMGGGAGLLGDIGAWEPVMQQIHAQFCIICGRNERLYKKLQGLATGSPRIRVLGYTERVDEWMAMADLIISKAGAITVTEALAMELPMLLYRPIPGQEDHNANYAVQTGAATLAHDMKTATAFLSSVVQNPAALERMRTCAKRLQVRGGADRIADCVVQVMDAAIERGSTPSRRTPQAQSIVPAT